MEIERNRDDTETEKNERDVRGEIKVAVVGNPNTGKSSLINAIAGARLKIGNWPGVTVEKKEAILKWQNYIIRLIDLPGTYSLTPFSPEEKITRDHVFLEKPDVILCVVDSTNLERNLYFVVQLMELQVPLVLALNMFDEARKLEYSIDVGLLEKLLSVRAVPTVAVRGEGVEELKKAIVEVFQKKILPILPPYGQDFEEVVEKIRAHVYSHNENLGDLSRAVIIKVIEGDTEVLDRLGIKYEPEEVKKHFEHIEKVHGEDIESFLANARYGVASGVTKRVLRKPMVRKITLTERLDSLLLNRYIGPLVFLLVMWLLFKLTFDLSNPFVEFLDETIGGPVSRWFELSLRRLGAPDWLVGLTVNGIIGGVGSVISFVPLVGVMMFLITFLENSGYAARAAFLTDHIMRRFGLGGKSFIPMLLGFGCNVPSVYATRVLEHKERILTLLLIPFMSCSARLPVFAVFTATFFPQNAGLVLFTLYLSGLITAFMVGYIIHRFFYGGESTPFIMELPPYRLPTLRDLRIHTWLKLKHFVIKVTTWILLVNVLIWVLLNVSPDLGQKHPDLRNSLLGRMGNILAPIFEPLGFGNWESTSSLIVGIMAKEAIVSNMAQIYGTEETEEQAEIRLKDDLIAILRNLFDKTRESFENLFSVFEIVTVSPAEPKEASGLLPKIRERFSPSSAVSFMIFTLLYWPCFVYGVTVRAELGSFRLYGQAILIHFFSAYTISLIVYQTARLIGVP